MTANYTPITLATTGKEGEGRGKEEKSVEEKSEGREQRSTRAFLFWRRIRTPPRSRARKYLDARPKNTTDKPQVLKVCIHARLFYDPVR